MIADLSHSPSRALVKIGVIVNPVAGMGGSVGLKGSDGEAAITCARARGALPGASGRARLALEQLGAAADRIELIAWSEEMGGEAARAAGFTPSVLHPACARGTTAADTRAAAGEMAPCVALLLFAGGDGTAVDVLRAVGTGVTVLGVPAGVKMHSAVFGLTPRAAGHLARMVAEGECHDTCLAEVADIDEDLLREGVVSPRLHGCLRVPFAPDLTQSLKARMPPSDDAASAGVARHLRERLGERTLAIVGPGTTTSAILDKLGVPATLLGVDVIRGSRLLKRDASESDVLELLDGRSDVAIVVAPVGGQGFILGRGNQQISPQVVRSVGSSNIVVVATEAKITSMQGRAFRVDTGDEELDRELAGYIKVLSGYHRELVYRIAA